MSKNETMNRLMDQSESSVDSMLGAGGDAETAAKDIVQSPRFEVSVRAKSAEDGEEGNFTDWISPSEGKIEVVLNGRSGVPKAFLREGTGVMRSNQITTAVHELAHAHDLMTQKSLGIKAPSVGEFQGR